MDMANIRAGLIAYMQSTARELEKLEAEGKLRPLPPDLESALAPLHAAILRTLFTARAA